MLRTTTLLAAIFGLPLVVAGCGDDAEAPSAPRAESPVSAARASARAADHVRFQVKDRAANATFISLDPTGCVETTVFVFGSQEATKDGAGKPTTGPLAVVRLTQFDFCNSTIGEYFGITEDAVFEVSRQFDHAHLKASVAGFLDETGAETPAVVDLTWTGAGDTFSETFRDRQSFPGATLTQWFRGTFRPAQVSGTVIIGKTNFATAPLDALIIRATQGTFQMVRSR